jgi:hypothetical protein
MRNQLFIGSLIFSAAIVLLMNSITGCANMVPPSGGPRDSIPPRLILADPLDSALRVSEQKITLTFDEFIELKSPSEQILISPFPQKAPQYDSRLKTITIRLKDSLLPSTTYVIDFGQAIADINEGNLIKGYRFVFSTGDYLDTLELKGSILSAETGMADSTMLALLYKVETDSAVCKNLPGYITRLDGMGRFRFSNLPEGTYYVFGLQDTDGNKKYTPPSEAFAFLDTPVRVGRQSDSVSMFSYQAEKPKKQTPPASGKKLSFTTNLFGGAMHEQDTLTLEFQKPLVNIQTQRIRLFEDSVSLDLPLFFKDTTPPASQIRIAGPWKRGKSYKLYFDSAYATDTSGFKPGIKDTFAFRVRSEKENGSLRIRIKKLRKEGQPVLLFYAGDQLVYRYALIASEFIRSSFPAGSYRLAVLYDLNGNQRWDPGSYFEQPRRQPERVVPIEKPLTVRPEWENELQIEFSDQ